ncbi:MAG: hypothetical protein L3J84_09510 [Gammaproteobacteria bacterium]|nr:hypothetical protein [Gammaproteobacteria bacterium]
MKNGFTGKGAGIAVWFLLCGIFGSTAFAGDVAIMKVHFEQQGDSWNVNATLRHADTGWSHYADAWRVVDEKGKVLGTRTLYHPHEKEQPVTRNLRDLRIPADTHIVFIEAHDKLHGWSKQRVRVDLRKARGERFEVRR